MGKAKAADSPKTEAAKTEAKKYAHPQPAKDAKSVELALWAAQELKAADASKSNTNAEELETFLKEAYGEEIKVGGRTVGHIREKMGWASEKAEPSQPRTRSSNNNTSASTTDVVSCVITLQGMLKDSDYDTVKATIQEVAALLEKIGKQETLKLLDALSGRNQA